MRFHLLVLLGLTACGPLRNPFESLPAGSCEVDGDCAVASCPNACNRGQPFCTYPLVRAKADVLKRCPCIDTPSVASCAAPPTEACGPQPKCAGPFDVDQLRAKCVAGNCTARLADGGVVP